MRRVEHYKVIPVDKVQEHIDNGWQPWGSPMVAGLATQAVVMYEAEVPQDVPAEDKSIYDLVQQRIKEIYAQYWNDEKRVYEIEVGTPNEWVATKQELFDDVERAIKFEEGVE